MTTVGEVENQAVPLRFIPQAGIEELIDSGVIVDDEPSGHAKSQSEHRCIAVGVQEEELADPAGCHERLAVELRGEVGRRETPLEDPRVGRVNAADGTAERPVLGQPAIRLDFWQLGHSTSEVLPRDDVRITHETDAPKYQVVVGS